MKIDILKKSSNDEIDNDFMEWKISRWVYITSSAVAFIWLWISGILFSSVPGGVISVALSNIKRYAIAIALFGCLYVILSLVLQNMKPQKSRIYLWEKQLSRKKSYVTLTAFFILGSALSVFMYFNNVGVLGWMDKQSVSGLQWILITLFFCMLVLLARWYYKAETKANPKKNIFQNLCMIFVVIVVLAAAYRNFLPNVYMHTFNWEAYWASAYAQYLNVPVNAITNSFYGFYSVILYPYFRLVGFNVTTVAVSTAIQGAFVAACVCYVVLYITRKSYFIRLLGLLAALYYSIQPYVLLYPQGYPSRLVFTTALIATAVWLLKMREKLGEKFINKGILAGYFIAMMGMIWSKDFGLVGIASWTAFHIYLILSEHKFEKNDIFKLIYPVVAMIATFVIAWQTVSLLNVILWNGDPVTFRLFMFPVLGSNFAQAFSTELSFKLSPWMAVLLLLLFFLGGGIATTSLINKHPRHNAETSLGFMVATLALGMMVYYINRTSFGNLMICYYAVMILIIIMMKNLWNSLQNVEWPLTFGQCTQVAALMLNLLLISAWIVVGTMNVPELIRELSKFQNMESLEKYTEEIKQNIPEGAMFYGVERTLLSSQLEFSADEVIWSNAVNYTAESWQNVHDVLASKEHTIVFIGDYGIGSVYDWAMSKDEMSSLYDKPKKFTINENPYYILTPKRD